MTLIISPDCRDGNHRKCNGDAWDLINDQPWECECPGHYPDKEES